MAIFGFGKDKKEGGTNSDLVLAYLEDAQRVRAPFTLAGPRKAEVSAILQSIDETEGTATFQLNGPLMAEKGTAIDLVFIQEGLRVGAASRLVEIRHGAAILDLPETLELKERRGLPRARVNSKEGATFTALTGLFEGVGITGVLENVSESGARVRVEKGMSIKGEKRLSLGVGLVPAGQPFILIKLNKVPKCPAAMELEGLAVYLDAGATGLIMGLKFTRPKSDVSGALRGMVTSRASAIPTVLPPKVRRKPETQPSGFLADEPLAAAKTPAPREPAEARPEPPAKVETPARVEPIAARPAVRPALPAPEAAALAAQPEAPVAASQAEPVKAPAPPVEEEAQATTAKGDSLMRLKKRSRAIVALSRTPAFNDILKGFLQEDGYGRVFTTTFPDEVQEFLRQPNLGALLLDGNMGIVEALEFVNRLRSVIGVLPPVILAAEDISTAVVLAARRNGVTQLVVRPYALDATFSALLAEQMGLK